MDNQHRLIRGYNELSQEQIDLINEIKSMGTSICDMVSKLKLSLEIDQRWVSIGQTNLQQGLMALTRSVAKPEHF
jgi:hypothetical protein